MRSSWPAVLVLAALCAPARGSNWPQWRGPGGLGVSAESGFPQQWSETRNVLWKAPVPGRGHSSPIVWEDRIFLTAAIEGETIAGAAAPTHYHPNGAVYLHPDARGADHHQTLKLLCLHRATGRVLWERTVHAGRVYDNRHRRNSYASGTPVTDGRYVWVFFESEGLYCFDFEGDLIWETSLGNIGKSGMGPGTSPVLYRDLIIVQCDQEYGEGSFIAALDKRTGREVWRSSRSHRRSWATPLLVGPPGRQQLVASGAESVIAYDPATGEELWEGPGVVSHPIPSAVAGHGMVILSAGSQRKRSFAVRLSSSRGRADIAWEYNKGTAYVPSPILYGDYVYLMTDRGQLTCLDAVSGEIRYQGARVPVAATFKSSPVAFEDRILISSEEGDTFVIRAGPVHEVLHRNSIGEAIWASPALSGGQIFLRGSEHLYCIGKAR